MGIACGEEELRYSCSLRSPMSSVSSSVSVRPGTRTISQTDLDRFLTARFVLFGIGPLGGFSVPVEHAPWHLMAAEGGVADDELVTTTGLPAPPEAPLIHYSPGRAVRVGIPSLVRETPV
jgi:uncharacterized protein YqjF (DUF2071 family)